MRTVPPKAANFVKATSVLPASKATPLMPEPVDVPNKPITHVLMVSTLTSLMQLALIVKTVPSTAPQPMLLNVW